MKIKFENNSNSKFWISDFCFIPGTSIADVTSTQKEEIERIVKNNNSIAKAIKEKLLKIEFAESFEEKESKKDKKNDY